MGEVPAGEYRDPTRPVPADSFLGLALVGRSPYRVPPRGTEYDVPLVLASANVRTRERRRVVNTIDQLGLILCATALGWLMLLRLLWKRGSQFWYYSIPSGDRAWRQHGFQRKKW